MRRVRSVATECSFGALQIELVGSILVDLAVRLRQALPLDSDETGDLSEVGGGVLHGYALADLGREQDVARHLFFTCHLLELFLLEGGDNDVFTYF